MENKDYTKFYRYDLDRCERMCLNKYLELEKGKEEVELNNKEKEILLELSKKNIKAEKHKLKGLNKVDTIVSFISLDTPKDFELATSEKLIGVVDSIKKAYLFYTPQSLETFEEVRVRLEKKKIEVKKIKIEITTLEDIYKEIYDIAINQNRNNILIDNTAGAKMVSDAFSRIAVEEGIKIATWQEQNIKRNVQKRLPGTGILYLNKAPERANFVSYKAANELAKKFKFKEAARLYEAINKVEYMNLYDALGETFNFDTLRDYSDLIKAIKDFKLYNIKLTDLKNKKKLEDLLVCMDILKNEYYTELDESRVEIEGEDLNRIYYGLLIYYIYNSTNSIELSKMLYDIQDDIYDFEINKIISLVDDEGREEYLNAGSLEEILKVLGLSEELFYKVSELEVNKLFLNEVAGDISMDEHRLSIPIHKIEDMELKNLKGKKPEKYRNIINALVDEDDQKLNKNDRVTVKGCTMTLQEAIEGESKNHSKMRNDFKAKIKKINEEIREKSLLMGLKKEVKDFFIYEDNFKESKGLQTDQKDKDIQMNLKINIK